MSNNEKYHGSAKENESTLENGPMILTHDKSPFYIFIVWCNNNQALF